MSDAELNRQEWIEERLAIWAANGVRYPSAADALKAAEAAYERRLATGYVPVLPKHAPASRSAFQRVRRVNTTRR